MPAREGRNGEIEMENEHGDLIHTLTEHTVTDDVLDGTFRVSDYNFSICVCTNAEMYTREMDESVREVIHGEVVGAVVEYVQTTIDLMGLDSRLVSWSRSFSDWNGGRCSNQAEYSRPHVAVTYVHDRDEKYTPWGNVPAEVRNAVTAFVEEINEAVSAAVAGEVAEQVQQTQDENEDHEDPEGDDEREALTERHPSLIGVECHHCDDDAVAWDRDDRPVCYCHR